LKPSNPRDRGTLERKRKLTAAFSAFSDKAAAAVGLQARRPSTGKLYTRKENATRKKVVEFYMQHSHADPCKRSKTRQLLRPVVDLHKEYSQQNPSHPVSLRSFYRMKPPRVASVKKAKFRQCL
jgi:hypothetical protein